VEHEQIAKSLALLPPDRRTYWSEKVNESKAQLESVLLRLQDARQRFRDYKTLRRQQALETSRIEYKALKTKLIECKRELQASQHHWSSLVASATLFIR
jgi:hypothetical protein